MYKHLKRAKYAVFMQEKLPLKVRLKDRFIYFNLLNLSGMRIQDAFGERYFELN